MYKKIHKTYRNFGGKNANKHISILILGKTNTLGFSEISFKLFY